MAAWRAGMCSRRTRHGHRECEWHSAASTLCSATSELRATCPRSTTTTIEFTPDKAGDYVWSYGTRMLRGQAD